MRYFRFTWQVKMGPLTEEIGTETTPVIVAKTEEEARAILEKTFLNDEVPITQPEMKELTLAQCIEEEEEEIRSTIRYEYILQQHGANVTVRQFSDLNRELKGKTETYWEALKEANRVLRLIRLARKRLDLNKVTIAQLQDCMVKLNSATTSEEFDQIWDSLPKKSDG